MVLDRLSNAQQRKSLCPEGVHHNSLQTVQHPRAHLRRKALSVQYSSRCAPLAPCFASSLENKNLREHAQFSMIRAVLGRCLCRVLGDCNKRQFPYTRPAHVYDPFGSTNQPLVPVCGRGFTSPTVPMAVPSPFTDCTCQFQD